MVAGAADCCSRSRRRRRSHHHRGRSTPAISPSRRPRRNRRGCSSRRRDRRHRIPRHPPLRPSREVEEESKEAATRLQSSHLFLQAGSEKEGTSNKKGGFRCNQRPVSPQRICRFQTALLFLGLWSASPSGRRMVTRTRKTKEPRKTVIRFRTMTSKQTPAIDNAPRIIAWCSDATMMR